MRSIDDGAAIVLTSESGAGLKMLTSRPGFSGTDRGTPFEARSAAEPLTAIEVQQNHFMAEFGIARDRPGAAAFRVARMPARDNYLEGVPGGICQQGQTGGGSKQSAA
jgi:hypothetical protein